jgi:hypothetical protein
MIKTGWGKQNCSELNLSHCHFVHHKSYMGWLWIELRPLLWKASSKPPEAWDDIEIHVKVTFPPFFFSSWSQYCSFILKITVLVHVIIWDSMIVSYCPLIARNSLGKFLNQSALVFSVSKNFCQIILLFSISLQSKCQLFTTVIWNKGLFSWCIDYVTRDVYWYKAFSSFLTLWAVWPEICNPKGCA